MVTVNKRLKERAVYVYLPSVKIAEDWKARAEKQKTSVSKFVIEHVLNSLRQEDESNYVSRAGLVNQLRENREEIQRFKKDSALFKQLAEKLDTELKRYRAQPFLEEEYQGTRTYDRVLIKLLRDKGSIDTDRILDELNIDPKESELVNAVRRQLENLEAYGLVQQTARAWRWTG